MPMYEKRSKELSLDLTAGVPGILRTVQEVLRLPRVQEVSITKNHVGYWRWSLPDEPDTDIAPNFTDLHPFSIVRNAQIRELTPCSSNAAVVVGQMFASASQDGLNALAFVLSERSSFWSWYEHSATAVLSTAELHGLPCYTDPDIPEETLVLCAGFERKSLLTETTRAYKVTVPLQEQ